MRYRPLPFYISHFLQRPNIFFPCELTGPTPSAAADCTPSPKTYSNLADGSYTFKVFATDPANNADPTPAIWTFTVGVKPDTIIDTAVDGLSNPVSNGGTDPTNSIKFTYHVKAVHKDTSQEILINIRSHCCIEILLLNRSIVKN